MHIIMYFKGTIHFYEQALYLLPQAPFLRRAFSFLIKSNLSIPCIYLTSKALQIECQETFEPSLGLYDEVPETFPCKDNNGSFILYLNFEFNK